VLDNATGIPKKESPVGRAQKGDLLLEAIARKDAASHFTGEGMKHWPQANRPSQNT
jgi:hypothetical protein